MEFVNLFRYSAQSLRSPLLWLRRTPRLAHEIRRPFLIADNGRRSNWSGQRLKVVRRDRYRCRGCDRKGDEVTLDVHLIHPEASSIDAMLSLCPNCLELASTLKLSGNHIPDFLRQLWRLLHHSGIRISPRQTSAESIAGDASLQSAKKQALNETRYQTLQQRMSN